jgi:hypothetical protein
MLFHRYFRSHQGLHFQGRRWHWSIKLKHPDNESKQFFLLAIPIPSSSRAQDPKGMG